MKVILDGKEIYAGPGNRQAFDVRGVNIVAVAADEFPTKSDSWCVTTPLVYS